MGMNLPVQTFESKNEYFIADTRIGIVTATKTAAAAIQAHEPVTITDGKVSPVASTDLTALSGKLYGISDGAAAKDEEVIVYLTGEFFADALNFESGVTAADVEVALRNIGIFLK